MEGLELLAADREYVKTRSVQDLETGCWVWQRSVGSHGYGNAVFREFKFGTRGYVGCAHRLSYMAFKAPIPEGHQIDHLCRNRRCVNPDHLEAVTQKENLLRQIQHMSRDAQGNFVACA